MTAPRPNTHRNKTSLCSAFLRYRMNSIIGTMLRAAVAAVAPLAVVWTARPVAAAPVNPPGDQRGTLDPFSEMEKGRLLEWWILVADK